MKKALVTAAAVACTALPSFGFIKAESKSAINKDGSARFNMVMEIDLSAPLAMMGQAGGKNPLGDGHDMLVQMVKGMSKNVDVWSEAKVENTKGGATRVTLGGYTKDWLAMGDLKKAIAASGNPSGVPLDELPALKFMDLKTESGNNVITMAGLDDICLLLDAARKMALKKGENPGDMNVDEAEISQGLAQVRAQWPGIKGFAAPLVKTISFKSEIQVNGTISETEVFKKNSDNTATFTFTGDQLLGLADQIISDEELPSKIVKMVGEVKDNFSNEKSIKAVRTFLEPYVKEIYGGAVNPKIVYKAGADVFDYAAETEKAKAAQSDDLKALIEEAGKDGGKVKLPGASK